MTLRVGVVGAHGRMGGAACAAVDRDPGLELVARVGSSDRLDDVTDAGADVAVEFTTARSAVANTSWLLERGVHVVTGTTGLSEDDLADLERRTGPANLLWAANFSVGAVLMMRFAEEAARHFPHVEITELHHERKADAPSGTSLETARRIAASRTRAGDVPGPTGSPARGQVAHGVPIHSVRLPGLVAHQAVIFGGPGQTLTVRHDSLDRSSFMPGVLLAVKRVADLPGLTVGLDTLL